MTIDELLKVAIDRRASDLHLKVGTHPIIRIDGALYPLEEFSRVTQEEVVALAQSVMTPAQKERLRVNFEVDLAYSAPGLGRFRSNCFLQRGTIGMVFRVIPTKIPTFAELFLPAVIEKLSLQERGLILVTGTTGSGKSTTLATMVDYINRHRTVNIVTIEDPIEFLHRDRRGIVSQREVGTDTESFALALRSALRQDPDVILVGEMRDFETVSTALLAAETGHLVLSTLHTLDAVESVNRIIAVFPPYQQKQVRIQLAAVLQGIISMRLVPRADGKGRVPAIEALVATETIREAVLDQDKTRKIRDFIAAGRSQYGMQTFDQSLYDLLERKLITYQEALKWCSNPDDFTLKVKGVQSTADSWGETQKTEIPKIDRFGV